ncbi:hypothetical protein [Agrobacterium vitis]|uniref:hypothetical protein n=1 Tax=Agrobacterium vitis TaxID=373 RepID=UPI00114CE403|nr:hypothetical protein [Agrobacterium vitis]MUO73349.1 hypothetical protein [Agrobacterium vitis]MUO87426.1 hypothetical protein [Agrobacterium vitis]MVA35911.1 hypothetical protein [Agrobacterium vitis]
MARANPQWQAINLGAQGPAQLHRRRSLPLAEWYPSKQDSGSTKRRCIPFAHISSD